MLDFILKHEEAIRSGAKAAGIWEWYMDEAFTHLKESSSVPFIADINRLHTAMKKAGFDVDYDELMGWLGPHVHKATFVKKLLDDLELEIVPKKRR